MPSLKEIQNQMRDYPNRFDFFRRGYLKKLGEITGRNSILYYSGWRDGKVPSISFEVNDDDINAFMTCIHGMDRSRGLDLILHTPGGEIGATESIVNYLREIFGINIRVIVPQLAMSAGTMIACSSEKILMGRHSSLGPIDPQYRGVSAQGILAEFERAYEDVKKDKELISFWNSIISKYGPTLIGECQNAVKWSEEITRKWLGSGMFRNEKDPEPIVDNIMSVIASHDNTRSHNRHISAARAKEIGLRITMIEDDPALQDAVLSVHHSAMLTLSGLPVSKIVENQDGVSMVGMHEQ